MVDLEILKRSNCHKKTKKTAKRKDVWAIDPRFVDYAVRKTVEFCEVNKDEIAKCRQFGNSEEIQLPWEDHKDRQTQITYNLISSVQAFLLCWLSWQSVFFL